MSVGTLKKKRGCIYEKYACRKWKDNSVNEVEEKKKGSEGWRGTEDKCIQRKITGQV